MANIIKLYAAYKAGFLGNNILDTYFSFMANMISEERLAVVEDTVIAAKFKERYTMDLPLPFIRQVLGVGVQNGSFIEDHGKCNFGATCGEVIFNFCPSWAEVGF